MRLQITEKALFAAIMIAAPFSSAFAKHLNPQEALARIEYNAGLKRMPGISNLNLIHTEKADGNEMVYVFNSDHGFILVSADDRMPALLGYSQNGTFDPSTSSPSLNWWIAQYAEEGAHFSSSISFPKESVSSHRAPSTDKEEIPYLMQTLWGQQNPYNFDCPEIGTSKCVTGCIATAMAQVIKYHAYPETGFGENPYEWNDTTLNYNFGSAKFQYSDMLDSYRSSSASDDQKKAVADLMYACGVAVNMNYNEDESGATDTYIAYALRHYFKFDNEVKLLKRSFFSDSEWEDLIYSELKEKRPVIMGGQARDGGHQFICDGYDGDGFFHINWGWEGLGDGYFLLAALNPEIQGTGGHQGGYNSEQSVICGIKPASDGDSNTWYPVYASNSIGFSNYSNTSIDIEFAQGGIFNYSQEEFTVEAFLEAVAENGDTYIADSGVVLPFDGAKELNLYGYGGLGTMSLPKNLSAGKYKCYIMIKTPEGNMQNVLFPYTAISYINIEVDSSGTVTCNLGQPEARAEIKVTEFEPDGEIIAGKPTTINVTVENIGEVNYDGTIQLKIFRQDSDTALAIMNFSFGTIESGKSSRGYITPTFTNAGTFDIIFYDQYGEAISEPFTISIAESGVEEIMDIDSKVDVFSYNGTLLKKNADKDYISNLPKGIYIIKSSGKTLKVIK